MPTTITATPNTVVSSTTQAGLTTRTGTVAWVNVNNAKVSDGSEATNANTADAGYQYLIASDFRVGGVPLADIISATGVVSSVIIGLVSAGTGFATRDVFRARTSAEVFTELGDSGSPLGLDEGFYTGALVMPVAKIRDSTFGIVLGPGTAGTTAVVDALYMRLVYSNSGRRSRDRAHTRVG